jgi:hypothetical protein
MAKARSPRKRAVVRSAKRSRNNTVWYGITALVLILGIVLIAVSRGSSDDPPHIFVAGKNDPDAHLHAALGVYDCDHWVGDGSGDGVWSWPFATPSQSPSRADNTNIYAGLHSHGDGVIHMEPSTREDAGKNATVGRYFRYGGWKVDETSFNFLGVERKNGDMCGDKPGTLQWKVARWNPDAAKQAYTVEDGNPADWWLHRDEIVVIAFLPEGTSIDDIGDPPSVPNLANATGNETPPGQMPSVTTLPGSPGTAGSGSTTPGSATGGSTAPATTPTTAAT